MKNSPSQSSSSDSDLDSKHTHSSSSSSSSSSEESSSQESENEHSDSSDSPSAPSYSEDITSIILTVPCMKDTVEYLEKLENTLLPFAYEEDVDSITFNVKEKKVEIDTKESVTCAQLIEVLTQAGFDNASQFSQPETHIEDKIESLNTLLNDAKDTSVADVAKECCSRKQRIFSFCASQEADSNTATQPVNEPEPKPKPEVEAAHIQMKIKL